MTTAWNVPSVAIVSPATLQIASANVLQNVVVAAKAAAVVVSVRAARACPEAAVRLVKAVWAAPANVLQNAAQIRIVPIVIAVRTATVTGIVFRARPVVMTAVAIVATAVTAQHVAAIQTMCVVQIQVLIAAVLMKPAVKAPVVLRAGSVVQEVIAVKMIKSAVMAVAATLTYAKNAWMASAKTNVTPIAKNVWTAIASVMLI